MATTSQLRHWWRRYECNPEAMTRILFCQDHILVAPEAVEAFNALATVLKRHRYALRTGDTDSYNCRTITGGRGRSLHSYGIALDINWTNNPYRDHPGRRGVRYSEKPRQAERAAEVRAGRADTDMTPGMIADILSIRTVKGKRVFQWGGDWSTVKDAMHFQIDVPPGELAEGLDQASVGGGEPLAELPEDLGHALESGGGPARYRVIARSGLRLRSGPGTGFDIMKLLPLDALVFAMARDGDWAQVSLNDDGNADGHVHAAYLRLVEPGVPVDLCDADSAGVADGLEGEIELDDIYPAFHPSARGNIDRYWPEVRRGLEEFDLLDADMIAMALGTIKAESAGFEPISEARSKYNTHRTPFDRYEAGTRKGRQLGNTRSGDGARYKGRGFIQLTGRYNYATIGAEIGVDLVGDPDQANGGAVAGRILACFLAKKESAIRKALRDGDLRTARKLVNGGQHGFSRFKHAYETIVDRMTSSLLHPSPERAEATG